MKHPFTRKKNIKKISLSIKVILFMIICTILTASAQIIWKLTSKNITTIQTFIFNPFIITGFILYILASVFYILALKKAEISIVFPMISLSFVWGIILSNIFIEEKIITTNYIGIGFIILGVIILGIASKK